MISWSFGLFPPCDSEALFNFLQTYDTPHGYNYKDDNHERSAY